MRPRELVSIVIPVFNEEGNIFPLYERVIKVFTDAEETYEIIFVNDGSYDSSLEKMKLLHEKDSNIRIISFTRNFGHQLAITAGLEHALGNAVIVMDADLQHPPEVIPEMIAKWKEGYDVVFTIRQETQGIGVIKRISSKLFYKIINRISDTKIHPGAADFRLMSRKTINYFKNLKEHTRFIRGLISWLGFSQASIEIKSPERFSGKTKYSYKKMLRFASQGLTSFSNIPLLFSFYIGLFVSFICFLYIAYSIYTKFITQATIPGWTSTIITLLFLGGLILIILGILGLYVGQILVELRNRPLYVVDELVGFKSEDK